MSSLARADIYKYVDHDGVIHFSNVSRKGQLVERHSESRPTPAPARPAAPNAGSEAARNPTNYDAYIREAARLYQIPKPSSAPSSASRATSTLALSPAPTPRA